jgi:hypothetical protein
MPRLGSLFICERIIEDKQSKPTCVSIFQTVRVAGPTDMGVPKETIAAMQWAVFCEWFLSAEDRAKKFDQVLEVLLPDGSASPIRGRLPLSEVGEPDLGVRAYIYMFGIPVSQVGLLSVTVWLESNGERVTDIYSYPVKIEHIIGPPAANGGGSVLMTMTPTPTSPTT